MEECAEIAGISSFVNQSPLKYDTKIGTTGIELSGGQKQRILIARAIYKNPLILFLDEATSSLDALNESAITDRILKYCKDRTLVIAAHRLSTVKNADNILFMRQGRIVGMGTHEELIALRGEYFELVSNQLDLSE